MRGLPALLLAACAMETSGAPDAASDVDISDDAVSGADAAAETGNGYPDAGGRCESFDPAYDTDGDGLSDAIEDRDRDCIVDPGETDALNADTDGDGLADGDEDVDRNGHHDVGRGELDPLRVDTDGDGVPDGNEPLALVCTPNLAEDYLDHRYAAPGGWTAFVPPQAAVELLEGGESIVFSTPGAVGFTMLHRELVLAVGPRDVLLSVREGARALGGDAWFALLAHSGEVGVHVAELAIEFPEPVPVALLMDRMVGLPVALPTSMVPALAMASRVMVRIEAEGPHTGAIDGRTAINVRFDPDDSAAASACGIDCIGGRAGERVVPFCEEVLPVDPAPARLLVVLEPSAAREPAVIEMLAAADEVIAARAAQGVPTDVWLASSEAHLVEGGARSPALRIPAGKRLLELAAALPDAGADERPWATAHAALTALAGGVVDAVEPGAGGGVTVLLIGLREDTEFRGGETLGRDGNSERPPLLQGEQRDARTGYYADAIAALGARVVAVAPMGVRVGPLDRCASLTDAAAASGVDDGLSFTDLAGRLHGARIDACYLDAPPVIGRELARELGRSPGLALTHRPVGASLRAASGSGTLPPSLLETGDGREPERVGLPETVDRERMGVAYLVWESSIVP